MAFSYGVIIVKPGMPASTMWLRCTKSPQSRNACASGGVVGLMSTSDNDTVGFPVIRPWPGRDVRRKW